MRSPMSRGLKVFHEGVRLGLVVPVAMRSPMSRGLKGHVRVFDARPPCSVAMRSPMSRGLKVGRCGIDRIADEQLQCRPR